MKSRATQISILVLLAVLLGGALVASCMTGPVPIPPAKVVSTLGGPLADAAGLPAPDQREALIVTRLRLPRAALGALVGAALASAGAALQGLFRNPLADPGLIGVSAGAAVGAGAVIVFGSTVLSAAGTVLESHAVMAGAAAGGIGFTLLIYRISRTGGRVHVPTMLLCGVAVNALAGALIGMMIFLADLEALRDFTFWSLGSLSRAPAAAVAAALPLCALLFVLLLSQAGALNVLLLGDAEAGHLGLDARRVRLVVIVASAGMVGGAVALSGTIGFVGLVVPHLARLLVGPDHRFLIPASALAGGALLVVGDLAARALLPGVELPIGVISAFIGAPFFLFLLLSARRRELSG